MFNVSSFENDRKFLCISTFDMVLLSVKFTNYVRDIFLSGPMNCAIFFVSLVMSMVSHNFSQIN
jgi:hypothetical protein